MTALLEVPEVRQRVHRLSVEAYHRAGETGAIDKHVELLRGFVITKMSKSPLHEAVCHRLMKLLPSLVPAGYEIRREGPLTFADSEPEPDFSIVHGHADDWLTAHPSMATLVIEAAVSSSIIDAMKADIYAEAGVPEYWLIMPESRSAEMFLSPKDGNYTVKKSVSPDEIIQSASIPGILFKLSQLFPSSH